MWFWGFLLGRNVVIMIKKCRAIKIAKHGYLTDENGEAIHCPIREKNCTLRCAWFSAEEKILRCKNTIIGALRGKPMQSFRLYSGPDVHSLNESLTEYEVPD